MQKAVQDVETAQQQEQTSQIIHKLAGLVDNSNILDPEYLGQSVISGMIPVRSGSVVQDSQVFLFERIFLCCAEPQQKSSPRIGRRRRASSAASKISSQWVIASQILVADIIEVKAYQGGMDAENPKMLCNELTCVCR